MKRDLRDIARFITIDDDPVNNMICKLTIEMVVNNPEVVTFTSPQQGFEYIRGEYAVKGTTASTILFLDINMPGMSGWEFLERFDRLDSAVKEQIQIYILSSSVDARDRSRSYTNKNVKEFLVKPLVHDNVIKIIDAS
jgi:CheY-like chemotaxis protein